MKQKHEFPHILTWMYGYGIKTTFPYIGNNRLLLPITELALPNDIVNLCYSKENSMIFFTRKGYPTRIYYQYIPNNLKVDQKNKLNESKRMFLKENIRYIDIKSEVLALESYKQNIYIITAIDNRLVEDIFLYRMKYNNIIDGADITQPLISSRIKFKLSSSEFIPDKCSSNIKLCIFDRLDSTKNKMDLLISWGRYIFQGELQLIEKSTIELRVLIKSEDFLHITLFQTSSANELYYYDCSIRRLYKVKLDLREKKRCMISTVPSLADVTGLTTIQCGYADLPDQNIILIATKYDLYYYNISLGYFNLLMTKNGSISFRDSNNTSSNLLDYNFVKDNKKADTSLLFPNYSIQKHTPMDYVNKVIGINGLCIIWGSDKFDNWGVLTTYKYREILSSLPILNYKSTKQNNDESQS